MQQQAHWDMHWCICTSGSVTPLHFKVNCLPRNVPLHKLEQTQLVNLLCSLIQTFLLYFLVLFSLQ